MEWSPKDAMNAYLHTLELCKIDGEYDKLGSRELVEPKCMEFVSALAAGKRAKLMLEVATEGITPLTIALGAAAKQIGGQLICILPRHNDVKRSRAQLVGHDLEDAITFVHGNPCEEAIMRFKNIDFAVVDANLDGYSKLFKIMDVNPSGSTVVAHNLHCREGGVSFAQVMRGKKGVESVTLPIGEGIELTRIGSTCRRGKGRRHKRFHVTFEN